MIRIAPDLSIVGASPSQSSMQTASRKAVGQSAQQQVHRGPFSGTDVPEKIVAFLRQAHPSKTSECVSALTGVSENTVKKWLSRASVPNGVALLKLIAAYGPEFLAHCMPKACGWLSEAARLEKMTRLHAEIEDRKRALGGLQ